MRTTDVGNLSTLKCMQAFLEAGYLVSIPFGDGCPYDLIIDDRDRLQRVECKTARLRSDGAIDVCMKSNNGRWFQTGGSRLYSERVDLLAAYCPETDKVYIIAPEHLSQGLIRLRVSPTVNNQVKGIRWARDFELRALHTDSATEGITVSVLLADGQSIHTPQAASTMPLSSWNKEAPSSRHTPVNGRPEQPAQADG